MSSEGTHRIQQNVSGTIVRTTISIEGNADPGANYLGWTPSPTAIRLVDPGPATTPVAVTLRNQNPAEGGQVVFYATAPSAPQDQLALSLPIDGSPVWVGVGGRFGRASAADRDAAIEVREASSGTVLSVTPVMIRVRKDANVLTAAERGRIVSAFATLNGAGLGAFTRFRDMHREISSDEAHGLPGFLPWHRAYLLDLERELQRIDRSVALPYWRFDVPAPALFSPDAFGTSDTAGVVRFAPSNPLQFWRTDGQPGIRRLPSFSTATQTANVLSEAATLRLGEPGNVYANFDGMEGNPHGRAHVSFSGFIGSIDTAARDPLFFLLHANVDRLWAKWQWFFRRFDPTAASYPLPGSAGGAGAGRVGHNLMDTLWPWNRNTSPPRPTTAPGGNFSAAPFISSPGPTPRVADMLDYQGVLNPDRRLGFDYDDVPFQF
jgi:tyrosinase